MYCANSLIIIPCVSGSCTFTALSQDVHYLSRKWNREGDDTVIQVPVLCSSCCRTHLVIVYSLCIRFLWIDFGLCLPPLWRRISAVIKAGWMQSQLFYTLQHNFSFFFLFPAPAALSDGVTLSCAKIDSGVFCEFLYVCCRAWLLQVLIHAWDPCIFYKYRYTIYFCSS